MLSFGDSCSALDGVVNFWQVQAKGYALICLSGGTLASFYSYILSFSDDVDYK